MRSVLVGFLFYFIFFSALACAQNYYVDRNPMGGSCSDYNAGTSITSPWCTLAKANQALQAGDTVYVRAGTYAENDNSAVIYPRNSGTSSAPITYQNYNGEYVNLIAPYYAINIPSGSEYIVIRGINADQGSNEASNAIRIVNIESDHNTIENGNFLYSNISPVGLRGIQISGNYNTIRGCEVGYIGVAYDDGWGEGIWLYRDTHHNLIENSKIYHASHNVIMVDGAYNNVIRNNEMFNDYWRSIGANTYEARDERNVIDGNVIHDTYGIIDWGSRVPGYQNAAWSTIFRRNVLYRIQGPAWSVGGWDQYCIGKDGKYYHNTAYDNYWEASSLSAALYCIVTPQGFMLNAKLKNNIFWKYGENRSVFYDQNCDSSMLEFEANQWAEDGDPQFVDPDTNRNFNLQSGSSCIDAGAFLTITTNSGSGTQMPVEDAGYFMDGFGIVSGDVIQLEGQTIAARIVSVDYVSNILTLNRTLSWTNGQGVALAYSGSAPDIGAFEYSSAVAPLCYKNSDCGSDPCKVYTCNNPGTSSASCSSQDILSCANSDGCCPTGCTEGNDNDCGGLVAWYRFDEGSGTLAADNSGKGNSGIINGALWTSDSVTRHALKFNGNAYVMINDSSAMDFSKSAGTIELWLKPVNPANGLYQLLLMDQNYSIEFNMQEDGDLFFYPWVDAAFENYNLVTNPLTTGEWQHVAVTWQYATRNVSVYVHGVKKAPATENVPTYWTALASTGDWHIGGSPVKSEFFNGSIDEVRIYSRALSTEEIAQHYNDGLNYLKADIIDDGNVDISDLSFVTLHFGEAQGQYGWNATADVMQNGRIDIYDMVFVASRFT